MANSGRRCGGLPCGLRPAIGEFSEFDQGDLRTAQKPHRQNAGSQAAIDIQGRPMRTDRVAAGNEAAGIERQVQGGQFRQPDLAAMSMAEKAR